MYAMTAAHKTLPLPAYVQVTNLRNGSSVIVRVNDRGPFKDGRIIDLSYTAAAKLDMLKDGHDVRRSARTDAGRRRPQPPAPPQTPGALYVQAGAFGTEENASRLLAQLRAKGVDKASCVRTGRTEARCIACASGRFRASTNSTASWHDCARSAWPMRGSRRSDRAARLPATRRHLP